VQHHAADQLHVEVALAEGTLGGLPHGRERWHQDIVELLPVRQFLAKRLRARAQFVVGEPLEFLFQAVDGVDARTIDANAPVIGSTEYFAGYGAEHCRSSFLVRGCVRLTDKRSTAVVIKAFE